jgi:hypothetical protein
MDTAKPKETPGVVRVVLTAVIGEKDYSSGQVRMMPHGWEAEWLSVIPSKR